MKRREFISSISGLTILTAAACLVDENEIGETEWETFEDRLQRIERSGQIVSGGLACGAYHTGSNGPHTGSHGHHTGSHGHGHSNHSGSSGHHTGSYDPN